MNADHNIHRNRKSQRASWWNYGNDGAYFVTINCLLKRHYFGEILEEKAYLFSSGYNCTPLFG